MGRVPAAVDLGVVVPQLALLGAWDGVVSLPLQVCLQSDKCTRFSSTLARGWSLIRPCPLPRRVCFLNRGLLPLRC